MRLRKIYFRFIIGILSVVFLSLHVAFAQAKPEYKNEKADERIPLEEEKRGNGSANWGNPMKFLQTSYRI